MTDTAQTLWTTTQPARVRDSSRVRDFVDLLKPRVMSLVVFTGLVGVMIAPAHIHPFEAALAVLAIALGSGAAGAINMWYERDLDALIKRTANRPLPAVRVAPDDALGLGVLLSIFSVLLMALATNFVAASIEGWAWISASTSSAGWSPDTAAARIAPRSRRCRTSERVSMPESAGIPRSWSQSVHAGPFASRISAPRTCTRLDSERPPATP